MHLTGIVLAGGKSSRMGHNKGLTEFRGKKLIEYPLSLLEFYCNELIISSNSPEYQQFGFPVVPDEVSDKGPLSGLVSALKKSSADWNIVLPCDMPFINRNLIDALIGNFCSFSGVVPVHNLFVEPLTAVYHKDMTVVFSHALERNELSLHSVIRIIEIYKLPVDKLLIKFPLLFSNFNYPSDLKTE
jgi:molybdopterin-guanine dinucleotide biosynthesis protein A